MYLANAITTQGKLICHETHTILAPVRLLVPVLHEEIRCMRTHRMQISWNGEILEERTGQPSPPVKGDKKLVGPFHSRYT